MTRNSFERGCDLPASTTRADLRVLRHCAEDGNRGATVSTPSIVSGGRCADNSVRSAHATTDAGIA
jgi:hypothetical protein